MAINRLNFKDNLKGKRLLFSDDFYKLRGKKITPENSFSYYLYDALNNTLDFKTNNYSNLFLSNRDVISNFMVRDEIDVIQISDVANQVNVRMSLTKSDPEGGTGDLKKMFYFNSASSLGDGSYKATVVDDVDGKSTGADFNIVFTTSMSCEITHEYNGYTFYLVSANKNLWVLREKQWGAEEETWLKLSPAPRVVFWTNQYNPDVMEKAWLVEAGENKDELYLFQDFRDGNVNYGRSYLGFKNGVATMEQGVDKSRSFIFRVETNTFAVDTKSRTDISPQLLDESWVSYDNTLVLGGIDAQRKISHIPSQLLLHHEYNTESGVNVIPLKNNLTYKGNSIKGSYIEGNDVCFRFYNSINSGFTQERGTDAIALNYTFQEQEYEVKDGQEFVFTMPANVAGKAWNVSETAFVKNGAFGSDVPYFSDKIKRLTETPEHQNGTYLCTWLHRKSLEDRKPQWMDRYYYPDIVSRRNALSGAVYVPASFNSYLDRDISNGNDASVLQEIADSGFYDKPSDMMLEAGNDYKYCRISSENVKEMMDALGDSLITDCVNEKGKKVNSFDDIEFKDGHYRKIKVDDKDGVNALNLNCDIFIDPKKRIGIQLFGSGHSAGLSIKNRTDLAPYHYYTSETSVMMLNNRYEVQHGINITELYGDKVVKLIIGDLFENIVVVSNMHIYILTYDLNLVSKLSFVDEEGASTILYDGDVSASTLFSNVGVEMTSYPFYNDCVELNDLEYYGGYEEEVAFFCEDGIAFPKLYASCVEVLAQGAGTFAISIEVSLSKLFTDNNCTLYNNNIYVPCKNDVLKLVFCPENEYDRRAFSLESRKLYPACLRVMQSAEYTSNVPNFPSGVVYGDRWTYLHSIFIKGDGTVYAFNYDQVCMAYDRASVYGIFNHASDDTEYHIFIQPLAADDFGNMMVPFIEFCSGNSFNFVKSNESGCVAFLNNLEHTGSADKTFQVYNRHKEREFSISLNGFDDIRTLDSYNYIDTDGSEKSVFVVLAELVGYIYKLEWDCTTKHFSRKILNGITQLPLKTQTATNNNDAILREASGNSIFFDLFFPSQYIFNNRLRIEWDISKVSRGWYNVNVLVDVVKAVFEVRINDAVLKRFCYSYKKDDGEIEDELCELSTEQVMITSEEPQADFQQDLNYSFFKPYVFSGLDVLSHSFYLGTIGKEFGMSLNSVLRNGELVDPYACKNTEIQNFTLTNKHLSLHEYQALRLSNRPINKLTLTVPCGVRSGVDEMVRFFRYAGGGAISNDVKITVNDRKGVVSPSKYDELARVINDALDGNIDALTNVNDIQIISK